MQMNRQLHFRKVKIRIEIFDISKKNTKRFSIRLVRSFGTEDRPTDRPVPARDEIFEYIIFRGADIEDLQVREPPSSSLTQDPAIVEVRNADSSFHSVVVFFVSSHPSIQIMLVRTQSARTLTSDYHKMVKHVRYPTEAQCHRHHTDSTVTKA